MKVEDLDILRPEPKIIRIGGKDIDVSFVPCGITFEVDKIVQELRALDYEKLSQNGPETKRAFELAVELCATFCSKKYPELDLDWFNEHANARQVNNFANSVQDALMRAYNSGEGEPKNQEAAKPKSKR